MSDELHQALASLADDAVEASAPRPELDGLWRSGRRRRRSRRAAVVAIVGAAVLVVALSVGAWTRDGSGEEVRTADVPTALDQSPCPDVPGVDGATGSTAPPGSAEAFVSQGSGGAAPSIVARATVDDEYWSLGELDGAGLAWHHLTVLQVTDGVRGASLGDHVVIHDGGPVPPSPSDGTEIEPIARSVRREISDLQDQVDALAAPLAALDQRMAEMEPTDPQRARIVEERGQLATRTADERDALERELAKQQHRLQQLTVAGRKDVSPNEPHRRGPPCHAFERGDDVIVALVPGENPETFHLAMPNSFFLVDGDGFSQALDAARRSVPGWGDGELLRLARESTPDEFLDRLRDAAG